MKRNIRLFRNSFIALGLFAITLVMMPGPGFSAGETSLSQIRAEVDRLAATNAKNNQEVARAMNLLTQIQQEFQSIRGQIQAADYINKETDRVYRDLNLRVGALEEKINQIHQLVQEMAKNPQGGSVAAPQSKMEGEFGEYQTLLQMMNAGDYRGAASGFMGFQKKYPQSQYGGNAQYWVGEAFFSMGDFAKAIQQFQSFVEKRPNHEKVPEAIYKQGLGFMRLKKYPEAKLFFQKVMADYPNTATAAKAQSHLHRLTELEKGSPEMAMNPDEKAAGGANPAPAPQPAQSAEPPPAQPSSPSNVPLF